MTMASAPRLSERDSDAGDVLRDLESDIVFGRFLPRERLVEDQLMARYGTKRYAVRQALERLEKVGIVTRTPNRGAAVRDFTTREVEEICDLRALLQSSAVDRMAMPVAPALTSDLREIQARHDHAVSKRDLRAIDQVNDAFHRRFFEDCGNMQLADAIARYANMTRAMRLYPLADPAMLEGLRQEHWAMIRALESGDRPTLRRLVVDHLQPSKRLYLTVRASLPG